MKKLIALLLALISVITLMTACGKSEDETTEATEPTEVVEKYTILEDTIKKYGIDDAAKEAVVAFLEEADAAYTTLADNQKIGGAEFLTYAKAIDAAADKFKEDFDSNLKGLDFTDDLYSLSLSMSTLSLGLFGLSDEDGEEISEDALQIVNDFSMLFTGEYLITDEMTDAISEKMQ